MSQPGPTNREKQLATEDRLKEEEAMRGAAAEVEIDDEPDPDKDAVNGAD